MVIERPAVRRPSIEQIWAWLAEVDDPEIPVISVVDLGIVREVAWDGDECVVAITPTYSGCPATEVIADASAALPFAGGGVRTSGRVLPVARLRRSPPTFFPWR